jgi:hypothetical protein
MLKGHIFPDPADQEAWLSAAMFPGRQDPTSNITYETQAKELRDLFDELGLDFSKLTHIFCVGGARHLDAAGVDDSVSMFISVKQYNASQRRWDTVCQ